MRKRATAVIGANYGDEGKGHITDWLVSQSDGRTVVARCNGGSQAGHTVVTPEEHRHVFSHFGSGSLAGADTYLAKHFVVNPIMFLEETLKLQRLFESWPGGAVATDPRCYVTTPYDMIINQEIEDNRGDKRHGSVGVGFGETIERNQYPAFRLIRSDLSNEARVLSKLKNIRDHWLPMRLEACGIPSIPTNDRRLDNRMLKRTAAAFTAFNNSVETAGAEFLRGKNVIFEGAQGLGLDMDGPNFPHVTRSNTGLTNIVSLAKYLRLDLEVIYVTRPYLTRHGAGPLKGEYKPNPPIKDETNTEHPYQGPLRFGFLDINELRLRIKQDRKLAPKIRASIALTCLDHIPVPKALLLRKQLESFLPVCLTSYGPTRNDVKVLVTLE